MSDFLDRLKSSNLVVMLFCQFIISALILFDIPIARQVFGFIYFTVVPGYIFIKLLKLNNLDRTETVILSVGLSIAFLMLTGLAINELYSYFGGSGPLSIINLMIVFNIFVFLGWILAYTRSWNINLGRLVNSDSPNPYLLLLIPPILSVGGAISVNVFGNNVILLFMMLTISALLILTILVRNFLPTKLYPLLLLSISISLLFHSSLISRYLINFGSDASLEYAIAKITIENAQWSPVGDPAAGRFDSMLSITILPTVYSNLLNIDLTLIFKILYPLIFSFVPLGLYQLWKKYIGDKSALIAAFLFMAQETFYGEMLGLARQMVAELFLVLLLLVVLNNKSQLSKKILLFAIFGAALVMSHYALSLIFAFFLAVTFIFLLVIRRPSIKITASMILIFLVMMFSWYIYTSKAAAFNDILIYGDYVYNQLGQFFNPESRGATVLIGLGLDVAPTIWNTISRAFAYLTELLIIIGFLALVTRRAKGNFENEYLALSSIAVVFLGAVIIVPGLAKTFNMTRFYHVLLFFLAPLIALGAKFTEQLVSKRETEIRTSLLLIVVLVPYFLFQTSFMYEVTGSQSWSLALSGYRMNRYQLYYKLGYISDQSYFGAQWMNEKLNMQYTQIFADRASSPLLISYGPANIGEITLLSNVTKMSANGTVYLGPLNTIDGIVVTEYYVTTSNKSYFLSSMNKVYSNGGSEVYKNPG